MRGDRSRKAHPRSKSVGQIASNAGHRRGAVSTQPLRSALRGAARRSSASVSERDPDLNPALGRKALRNSKLESQLGTPGSNREDTVAAERARPRREGLPSGMAFLPPTTDSQRSTGAPRGIGSVLGRA